MEKVSLTRGMTSEKLTVDGVEWTLCASYDTSEGDVRISGQPKPAEDAEHPFLARMMAAVDEDDSGAFGWRLPVTWLRSAAAARQLGGAE